MRRIRFDQSRRLSRRFGLAELLAGLGVLVLLALLAREIDRRWTVPEVVAGFGEAIDGDSLRVAGQEVRLKGIDAPEISQYCKNHVGRDYACGVEAKRWLNARLQRGAVSCRIENTGTGEPCGFVEVEGAQLQGTLIEGEEIPNVIDEIPDLSLFSVERVTLHPWPRSPTIMSTGVSALSKKTSLNSFCRVICTSGRTVTPG